MLFENLLKNNNEYYNCGGFALGLPEWVKPYTDCNNCPFEAQFKSKSIDDCDKICSQCEFSCYAREDLIEELFNSFDSQTALKIIVEKDALFLLNNYNFLKIIDINNCAPSDKIIAYRIFVTYDKESGCIIDQDFHFRLKVDNEWYEKSGTLPYRKLDSNETTSFDQPWKIQGMIYNSPIVYFLDCRGNKN